MRKLVAAGVGLAVALALRGAGIEWSEIDPFADERPSALADAAGDTEGTAVDTVTKPRGPGPIEEACVEADREAGRGPDPRPAQPAPVPGQPGQHALLFEDALVKGNLDLAPGGGFEHGRTAASDAKTVFVVCRTLGPSIPTGETCEYVIDGTGERWYPDLHVRTQVMVVYDAHSGQEVGRSDPIPLTAEPECRATTVRNDENVVQSGATRTERDVEWVREHLTGATYTP